MGILCRQENQLDPGQPHAEKVECHHQESGGQSPIQ